MKGLPLRVFAPVLSALAVFCAAPSSAKADQPYCREYTRTVWIGGQIREAYGTACLQPDGAWQSVGERPAGPQYESRFETPYDPYDTQVIIRDERPPHDVPFRKRIVVHHTQPIVIYRHAPPYGWGAWDRRFDSRHDRWHARHHSSFHDRDCTKRRSHNHRGQD